MSDLPTALRTLNDAAWEALRACLKDGDLGGQLEELRMIAASTDMLVDTLPTETNGD